MKKYFIAFLGMAIAATVFFTSGCAEINRAVTLKAAKSSPSGTVADWWVMATANGSWYYLDSSMRWNPFDDFSQCRPVYQGTLFNLPFADLYSAYGALPSGTFTLYIAADLQSDGILDGPILYDSVNVTVQ